MDASNSNDINELIETLNQSPNKSLTGQLAKLRSEHEEIDKKIENLNQSPPDDDQLLRRLKKQKLVIKDQIWRIEKLLDPDLDPDEYA